MDTNWAAEHLQTIRTLMERSALYRRALAPIMIFNGVTGTVAAIAGILFDIESPRDFVWFWGGVAIFAMAGSFLLVRRQALKESEPFWSPPTRRVTQAMLPALVAGLILGALVLIRVNSVTQKTLFELDHPNFLAQLVVKAAPDNLTNVLAMLWLPLAWVILYGCAFHAAGFFMQRGMRIFGWAFVLGGCLLLARGIPDWPRRVIYAHGIMGFFFGLLHLAYGVYLYFTEQHGNET